MGTNYCLFRICKQRSLQKNASTHEIPASPENQTTIKHSQILPLKYDYFSESEVKSLNSQYSNTLQPELNPPKKWKSGQVLGQGSFGCVYIAVNLETGGLMAIKQIPLVDFTLVSNSEKVREIEQEVEILSKLNHRNIVRYLGTHKDEKHLSIFMEYVAGGTISSLISKYGKISENLIKVYAKQILQGLEYLHFFKYLHRDIKGANVLINNDGVCKLADFGSAKPVRRVDNRTQMFSLKGTTNYMAPEVMRQEAYGRFADIWSFGCLVIEMATGKPPWHYKTNQIQVFMHVCTTDEAPELPEDLSEDFKDFILSCFKRVPSERLNAHKLLKHAFLRPSTLPSIQIPSSKSLNTNPSNKKLSSSAVLPVGLVEKKSKELDFEEMNPEHALKSPFNNIITSAKLKPATGNEESGFCLQRPSDDWEE